MLRGSLKSLGGETLLARAGIDGMRRAETLSVAELTTLAQLLLAPASQSGMTETA
jgi:16S rRNA (adenine1518-N6/adenine1519-N6)-dimethyltransferase